MGFKDYITEAESKVGKIILNQINVLDRWSLASWGAKNYVSFPDGIKFDVRGSKFRGICSIKLNKRDLYDIEYGIIKNLEYTIKHIDKNIFAKQIVNVLDNFIG